MFITGKGQNAFVGTQLGDTVLVLGAGASKHLGYPLGGELVTQILKNTSDQRCIAFRQLRDMGFESRDIKQFHSELTATAPASIDDFLSAKEAMVTLGRAAIAQVLISCEDSESLKAAKDNWYWQLGWDFRESFRINEHPPVIITFNYDRSLDWFLHSDIRSVAPKRFEYYRRVMKILHVHGRLGYLDTDLQEGFVRPYGHQEVTAELILKSAEGIRVISELEDDYGLEMKYAQQIIAKAKKILFLGFGYHQLNLIRLRIESENLDESFRGANRYFGTSVGMGVTKIADVNRRGCGRFKLINDVNIPTLLSEHFSHLAPDNALMAKAG